MDLRPILDIYRTPSLPDIAENFSAEAESARFRVGLKTPGSRYYRDSKAAHDFWKVGMADIDPSAGLADSAKALNDPFLVGTVGEKKPDGAVGLFRVGDNLKVLDIAGLFEYPGDLRFNPARRQSF